MKKLFFVSDIHGCLDEFDEMLRLMDADSPHVQVWHLGDAIDRGPDSVGVIRRLREKQIPSLKGNHEHKFLKWFNSNKFEKSVPDHYRKFSDQDIEFMWKSPHYSEVMPNLLAVHAGIKPQIPIEKQKIDDLLYLRYRDQDNRFVSLAKIHKLGLEQSKAKFWTEFGSFGTNIVYGHTVMDQPRIDTFQDGYSCYGIDGGCCFGKKLIGFEFFSKEFISVQARKVYYESKFAI